MLDASRTNETAAAEKISKLQEEKKVLQVIFFFRPNKGLIIYMMIATTIATSQR